MSHKTFYPRSLSRDSSPLLPQYSSSSISLQDLSPRPSNDIPRAASPSPPPAFYRDARSSPSPAATPSPSRSKTSTPGRRIQFAGPPPPIATSILLQAPRSSENHVQQRSRSPQLRRGSALMDPLHTLERSEKAIQNELQLLLDAQAAGLVQGFGGGAADDYSDAGSSTPTSRSVNLRSSSSRAGESGGVVPVRQPKRKPIGLRGARRGLLRNIGELAGIKAEKVRILSGEIERRDEVVKQVAAWEKKIEDARGQLSGYSGGEGRAEEDREVAELQAEERAVDNEIRELEDRLLQMKAKKRWLGEQIKESTNRREARLSSYRGALREAEREVKEFLRRPPIPVSAVMGDEEGFYALPPSRRTLGIAKEWWQKEESSLKAKKEETERDKQALEEGVLIWEDAVGAVTEFENELRSQMRSGQAPDQEMFRSQIGKMGTVIERLGELLVTAEDRGWNLLICAIGAELQAFKEGEDLLKGAVELREQHNDDQESVGTKSNGLDELRNAEDGPLERSQGGALLRDENADQQESEDDGPNLDELLIDRSHGDVD